jgi:hypothetical protein
MSFHSCHFHVVPLSGRTLSYLKCLGSRFGHDAVAFVCVYLTGSFVCISVIYTGIFCFNLVLNFNFNFNLDLV